MKALFITEKPSVAREFAAALNINAKTETDTWKETRQSSHGASDI